MTKVEIHTITDPKTGNVFKFRFYDTRISIDQITESPRAKNGVRVENVSIPITVIDTMLQSIKEFYEL